MSLLPDTIENKTFFFLITITITIIITITITIIITSHFSIFFKSMMQQPFKEEFYPKGEANHWTFLQCSKCTMPLRPEDVQNAFVCLELGCSYIACYKCKTIYLSSCKKNDHATCSICQKENKLIKSNTYVEEEKANQFHKRTSNVALMVMVKMVIDSPCKALVIDGSSLSTTSSLLLADNFLHVVAINGNEHEIEAKDRRYETHQERDRITVLHTKFSEYCKREIDTIYRQKKDKLPFPPLFNLIYIDGCGSWGGNPEINIREDIHRSILLLDSKRCILAVTFSQRDHISGKSGDRSDQYQLYIIWLLSRLGRSCRVILDQSYGAGMVFMIFDIEALTTEEIQNQMVERRLREFEFFKIQIYRPYFS